MKVLIVGAGKVGKYLADSLSIRHDVILLEKFDERLPSFKDKPEIDVKLGDGCDPQVLEAVSTAQVNVVIAATGDDEDNLVISQLAKNEFGVKRVVARVNNPKNRWLFTKQWGVDVAISSPHIILQLLEEELSLGDIVTLIKLREGQISLVELTVGQNSQAENKMIKDLGIPKDSVISVHVRDGSITVPHEETELKAGDDLLIVTNPKNEPMLSEIFGTK